MGWLVFADNWETGELTNTNKFQTLQFGDDIILRAIRTWIVVINDPVFTSLNMKLYSNELISGDNTPKQLIATSTNSLTKAEIHTLANGVKEIYFEFNYIPVNGSTLYNLVINGAGYTPTENSSLAWMKAFPDPVYSGGYTPTMETLPYAPYQLYAIGGRF